MNWKFEKKTTLLEKKSLTNNELNGFKNSTNTKYVPPFSYIIPISSYSINFAAAINSLEIALQQVELGRSFDLYR